jgi:hypothetical protein
MEQPCYKCGQAVEEGVPFCPHCSAPQIRVVIAEPAPLAAAATPEGAVALPSTPAAPQIDIPVHWSSAAAPCALAALIASLLISLGLYPVVAMFSAGFLAVILYRHRRPGTIVQAATGARLGALSGLFLFAISSILGTLLVVVLHKGPEIRNELTARINQAASRTSDPQALAMLDRLKTPGGLEFLLIFGLVFALFAAIALAGLGGALGGTILGRRNKS